MKTLKQTADDFQKLAECYKIQAIDIKILLRLFTMQIAQRMGAKEEYQSACLVFDASDEILAEMSEKQAEKETA